MAVKELSEHEIQVYLCKYLKQKGIRYWATPNGFIYGKDKLQAARYIKYLGAEGFMRGTFDLTLLFGNGNVAFLELKTPKGRPSKEQLEWLDYFTKNNYHARICKGLKEAIDFVEECVTLFDKKQ